MRFLKAVLEHRDGSHGAGLTLTVAPSGGGMVRQYFISRSMIVGILVVASLVLAGVLASLVSFGYVQRQAWQARSLQVENELLRAQLAELNELEQRIGDLNQTRNSLLAIAGVLDGSRQPASIDESVGESGTSRLFSRADPDTQPSNDAVLAMDSVIECLPLAGPRTRGFGRVGEGGLFHTGLDIAGQTGAPVRAAGTGVASFIGDDPVLGRVLVISHSSRLESIYGHNSSIRVRLGDFVTAGQIVAEVGSTGESSAPHLHFELRWQGKAVDPELARQVIPNST